MPVKLLEDPAYSVTHNLDVPRVETLFTVQLTEMKQVTCHACSACYRRRQQLYFNGVLVGWLARWLARWLFIVLFAECSASCLLHGLS